MEWGSAAKIEKIAPNTTQSIESKEKLIAKAKDLGIKGNIKSMKVEKLQAKILFCFNNNDKKLL